MDYEIWTREQLNRRRRNLKLAVSFACGGAGAALTLIFGAIASNHPYVSMLGAIVLAAVTVLALILEDVQRELKQTDVGTLIQIQRIARIRSDIGDMARQILRHQGELTVRDVDALNAALRSPRIPRLVTNDTAAGHRGPSATVVKFPVQSNVDAGPSAIVKGHVPD